MRWYTENIYIDIDTGERISKDKADKEYRIINTIIRTQINEKSGIKERTNECKRRAIQLNLFETIRN